MNWQNIIAKLKKENLSGRSGSGFPTGLKWEMVKNAKPQSSGVLKQKRKYIICNASEGEPATFKDKFILDNYPEEVIEGIKIALKTIDHSSAYIYINKNYYKRFKTVLLKLIGRSPIKLFEKAGSYIAGEETSAIEAIEGKKPEPRLKPPYPTQVGLFGFPTLVNNVETFYYIAKIAKGEYRGTRFYCLSGDVKNKGVYELPEAWSIKKILEETKNWPKFDFFVQSGGGASGEILLPKELNQSVKGVGSIIVYNKKKTNLFGLMKSWADFLCYGNCNKCVPCREGTYRLTEMINKKKLDKEVLKELFLAMEESSFCPLGKFVSVPFKGLIKKVMK